MITKIINCSYSAHAPLAIGPSELRRKKFMSSFFLVVGPLPPAIKKNKILRLPLPIMTRMSVSLAALFRFFPSRVR